jgi:hypothetical protein
VVLAVDIPHSVKLGINELKHSEVKSKSFAGTMAGADSSLPVEINGKRRTTGGVWQPF